MKILRNTLTVTLLSAIMFGSHMMAENVISINNGSYGTSGNWSPTKVPTSADVAFIRDGYTIDLDDGNTYQALYMILANRGSVNPLGVFNITNGTFQSTSTTTSTIGAAVDGAGNGTLNINTNGTASFAGILDIGVGGRGVVNVGTGGSLTVQGLNPNGSIRLGNAAGSYGDLNIDGGNVIVGNHIYAGSAIGGTGNITLNSGSLTVNRSLYLGNRVAGTSNGTFTMTGGTLTVKNDTTNADYLLVGASNAANQDTNGLAVITAGTVNANIIVGGNYIGTGKLILGPSITAINPMASTFNTGTIPLALSVRATGILQFDLSANMEFNMIDLSAGKVQFVDKAEIILNVGMLSAGLSSDTIDLLKVNPASTDTLEIGNSVTYTVIGNDTGYYNVSLAWNADNTILQAVITAIPEPSTYALLGVVFAIAVVMVRRRKNK